MLLYPVSRFLNSSCRSIRFLGFCVAVNVLSSVVFYIALYSNRYCVGPMNISGQHGVCVMASHLSNELPSLSKLCHWELSSRFGNESSSNTHRYSLVLRSTRHSSSPFSPFSLYPAFLSSFRYLQTRFRTYATPSRAL